MKILTAAQITEADRLTIENEPIASIDLMERAAETIAGWICNNVEPEHPLLFLIGKGNNGGDGLAVARILFHAGFNVVVYTTFQREELSPETLFNFKRLPKGLPVHKGSFDELVPAPETILIDALLGTGVHGTVNEPLASLIRKVNALHFARVISIDLPSGLVTEFAAPGSELLAIQANTTLALQFPKLSMLLPATGGACGRVVVLPIDLDPEYLAAAATPYHYITPETVAGIPPPPRPKFAHKGDFGHALLVCGSEGMMGAATLAVGAALRSGCGLVTLHTPREERFAVQANHPSALLSLDKEPFFSELPPNLDRFNAIGVGCGLGQAPQTVAALARLLQTLSAEAAKGHTIHTLLDADALNILASRPDIRQFIPSGTILTPHPGELRRLIGEWGGEEEKIAKTRELALSLDAIIVVKGAHTMVCMPDGECYFNSTGTPAMAKGGCGDLLAGLITGLLARGYAPREAALAGVWLHGLAGENAAEYYCEEGMNSSDMIDFIAEALADTQK